MEASRYRNAQGGCPVAEQLATQRALVLSHPWLSADKPVIDLLARILGKLSQPGQQVMAWQE
jgi:hypothetical protein